MSETVTITLSKPDLQLVIDAMLGYGARYTHIANVTRGKPHAAASRKATRIFNVRALLIDAYRSRQRSAPHGRVGGVRGAAWANGESDPGSG